MHENQPLEERVLHLETQVRLLTEAVFQKEKKPGWVHKIVGSMQDDPEFAEILKHGQAIRQADREQSSQAG